LRIQGASQAGELSAANALYVTKEPSDKKT
jgi:hypothetical protein